MNETCVDLSSALISPIILRGDNYTEWSTSIRNSLQAKQKIGFIDGSIPKPLTKPEFILWFKENIMIGDWILATIDPKISSTLDPFTNAKELWDTLERRLSIGVKARVYQLKIEISAFKQNGQSVEKYFLQLCNIWEELHCYKSTRDCSCNASEDMKKDKADELVYQFLIGLDDSIKKKVAFIITDKGPLPDLSEVYDLVITEEKRLQAARFRSESEEKHVELREKHNSCSHCGRKGHKIEDCFALHGYPESWNERQRNKSTRGRRGKQVASSSKSTNAQGRVSAPQSAKTNQSLKSSALDMDKFNKILNLRKMQEPESNIYSPGPSASSSSNRFPMAQKLEAKGGNGGKEWDDGTHEGISQIYIREGDTGGIQSIKFDYVENEKPKAGPTHAGFGSEYSQFTECFDLNHTIDEHILSVKCYFDEGAIQGLVIKTNIRTSAYMGYNVGTTFKLEVKGKKIIGFHGTFDKNYLISLGAYFIPLSPDNLRY